MVRWLRWHCPPDTEFEIRTLAVWGRARYLSVTEARHNTNFHTWMGKKHFCFFETAETGTEPRTLAWKATVLTTTLGPPPMNDTKRYNAFFRMDHDVFEEMVGRRTPRIQKQDTNMKRALQEPGLNLAIGYTQIFGHRWLLCVIGI